MFAFRKFLASDAIIAMDGGGGDDDHDHDDAAAAAQHVIDKKGRAVVAVNSKGRRNANFVRLRNVHGCLTLAV